MTLFKLDVLLSFNHWWLSRSCSWFSNMVFKLSAYFCWSRLIDISFFLSDVDAIKCKGFFVFCSHMKESFKFVDDWVGHRFSSPYHVVNKQMITPINLLCFRKRKIPWSNLEGLAPSLLFFVCSFFLFFLFFEGEWGFTPCKAKQPLQGIELQEKEVQKDQSM